MGTNQRDKQKNKLAEYWKAFIDTVGALIWKMNFILEFQGFAIRCQDDGRSAGFHLLFRVIWEIILRNYWNLHYQIIWWNKLLCLCNCPFRIIRPY